jgi:chitosanase
MDLTAAQKSIIERVVNAFETGSADGDYGDISIFNDGPSDIRQITYGRSQTTEYGRLGELVAAYVDAAGQFSDPLRQYVGRIGQEPLTDDADFKNLLKRAGREDPVMARVQDEFFDTAYFTPAMRWADRNGFRLPLSALVIYDSFIHSGSILSVIRNAFPERPPAAGGDEQAWVRAYVAARNHWLATHARPIVRRTTYRTELLQNEIDRMNWDLSQVPIVANGVRVFAA